MKQPSAIGIDVGGTKIALGRVRDDGIIIRSCSIETKGPDGFDGAMARLMQAIAEMSSEDAGLEAACGIGIGCPGPLNPRAGTIHNPYTLPEWEDRNIVQPLAERFGVPVGLENDADVAALAEERFGAGRECSPVAMLTFGTGVGSAVIIAGQIYRGVGGEHPEMGHLQAVADGPQCYCGGVGCLETVASGTAIATAGHMLGMDNAGQVFEAAAAGHVDARRIIERAVTATEAVAWAILHTYLPQRIVLGGGMMDHHFELFAPAVRRAIARAKLVPRHNVDVARAQLGNLAGIVGAAALCFSSSQAT
jgi:glucokinase